MMQRAGGGAVEGEAGQGAAEDALHFPLERPSCCSADLQHSERVGSFHQPAGATC